MNAHALFTTLETVWSFTVKAWSGVGPLVGVLIGAWLTRSWDKQKWMKDNIKQECKELLTAIAEASATILKRELIGGVSCNETNDVYLASLKVFQSRIFIEKDVQRHKLMDLWAHAVSHFNTSGDNNKFDDAVDEIRNKIIDIATKQ